MIAHVGGLPVEELLPVVIGSSGAWLIYGLSLFGRRRERDRGRGRGGPARSADLAP